LKAILESGAEHLSLELPQKGEIEVNFSVILICDKCEHKFWFEFTFGCMKHGEALVQCPECKNDITLSKGEEFVDGSVVINIKGATRGLALSISY
jgi:hypothetical protein